MSHKSLYFFSRKFIKISSNAVISLILSLFIFILYISFKSEIKHQLHLDQQKLTTDYSVQNISGRGNVLGKSVSNVKEGNVKFLYTEYDYRARVFDLYFKKNNSPLYGSGQAFVQACDKYGAPHECTLLPAIARIETNLCKTGSSAQQHNCWGYGGSGDNRIIYQSFAQAVDDITKRLMQGYSKRFFEDPEYGELTYCGAHCTSWGDHVKEYQDELRQFAKKEGYEL